MGFSWSLSKITSAEICPRQHYELSLSPDHSKYARDATGRKEANWGDQVHQALAAAVKDGTPLLPEMCSYESALHNVRRHMQLGAMVLVEQKYALTKNLEPTAWFGEPVWYRGIADSLSIYSQKQIAFVDDYKTGKRKGDNTQLFLMAQCVFSFYSAIEAVVARFLWLQDGSETQVTYRRRDMSACWSEMLPRVERYRLMLEREEFPPNPSGLCVRHCPVEHCQYHGKGTGYGRR